MTRPFLAFFGAGRLAGADARYRKRETRRHATMPDHERFFP
jgi:hypothetical protein